MASLQGSYLAQSRPRAAYKENSSYLKICVSRLLIQNYHLPISTLNSTLVYLVGSIIVTSAAAARPIYPSGAAARVASTSPTTIAVASAY